MPYIIVRNVCVPTLQPAKKVAATTSKNYLSVEDFIMYRYRITLIMAVHRMLLTVCLGIFWSLAYGRPDSVPNGHRPPECQVRGTLVCFAPMLGFAMSEGRQFSQPGANYSQIVTQDFYNNMCSIAQTVASCFAGYMTRCAPPDAIAEMQLLSSGITKVVSVCNETDSYSKFIKLASCGEKIKIPQRTCQEASVASIPADSERQPRYGFGTEYEEYDAILYFRTNVCCQVKTFKECIAPSVQSSCTAEEKTVAEKFGYRVLRAFECSDAVYQICNKVPK